MDKKQFIKTSKITAFVYIASFLVINWNDISWMFNYRQVSTLVSDFFNPYPSAQAVASENFYPNRSQVRASEDVKTVYTAKQNIIEIPKLLIEAPIIFSNSADNNAVKKDLDSGVAYYPGSVLPGQKGQIIILGHSAPVGWPKIKYDWVFSDLEDLAQGDEVLIDMNYKQYKYIVKEKQIVKKGEDITTQNLGQNSNLLTLISCWPPGKDYQRIVVYAELTNNQ